MKLSDFKRVLRETTNNNPHGHTLTREQRWQIRLNVADGLLQQYQITPQQHKLWTEPY